MKVAVLFAGLAGAAGAAADSSAPEQVHLALGQDTSSAMTVSWLTNATAGSHVRFGTDASKLDHTAEGDSAFTYSYESTKGYAPYTSPYIHHVPLVGLEAATEYFYQTGDAELDSWSEVFSFKTLPRAGYEGGLTFSVVGDLGQTEYSANTVQHMIDSGSDLILTPGDLSYADSEQTRWDSWGRLVEPLSASRAWMFVAGNHEVEAEDVAGDTFEAFQARFRMPEVQPAVWEDGNYDWGNSFYSFDVGSLHVLGLNPYTDSSVGSMQYAYAKADLAAVDRSLTPWVVVMDHNPVYNANTDHQNETATIEFAAAMEPLFVDAQVDLVLAGHVHAYSRSVPVADEKPTKGAPTYITIGCGGNREELYDSWLEPVPEWVAFNNGTSYGHGELFVNATQMEWTWHRDQDDEWVEMDSVVFEK